MAPFCRELGNYRIESCCDPEDVKYLCIDGSTEPEPYLNGVYVYIGDVSEDFQQGFCYTITYIEATVNDATPLIKADWAQTENCQSIDCHECPQTEPNLYKAVNCYDEDLEFIFKPSTVESIIPGIHSLNINTGDTLTIFQDNLCHGSITIVHPEVNGGEPYTINNVQSIKQLGLYNGKPYYKLTLTEIDLDTPGLELTFYTIYNSVEDRWEIWDTFDLVNGPRNSYCLEQNPYMIHVNTGTPTNCAEVGPINTGTCSWQTLIDCEVKITGNRNVSYCIIETTIEIFINCWTVSDYFESVNFEVPSYDIESTYENCDSCTNKSIIPPCIIFTDCLTGTEFVVSSFANVDLYVGKIIKLEVPLSNGLTVEKCYEVNLSEECPDIPTLPPGTFIACYDNCSDCIPSCECSRARNSSELAKRLTYVDCNGDVQQTLEFVGSGSLSQKYCVFQWLDEDISEIISFGDCVDNTCPEIPLPKRIVTPGYNTPICTPAQYERIVCRYAEIKYKETLTKRYGIENCCDDESLANDIKYELIHLQMLEDSDYVCVNNPRLCPPGCGYINMNIIHECPPEEPEIPEEPEEDIN